MFLDTEQNNEVMSKCSWVGLAYILAVIVYSNKLVISIITEL